MRVCVLLTYGMLLCPLPPSSSIPHSPSEESGPATTMNLPSSSKMLCLFVKCFHYPQFLPPVTWCLLDSMLHHYQLFPGLQELASQGFRYFIEIGYNSWLARFSHQLIFKIMSIFLYSMTLIAFVAAGATLLLVWVICVIQDGKGCTALMHAVLGSRCV